MAGITSAGVGSGLPLEDIINATLNAEDQPKLKRFEATKTRLSVELSALGAVKSSLSSLQDIIKKLADPENFSKRVATVKQPTSGDLISVATTDQSTTGSFNIEVTQLAQGSRAMSNGAFTAPTDVVNATAGKLTLKAGTKDFAVDIAAGATLEDIRNAINSSETNFGITANIINTGGASPTSKLVITSNVTGAGNDVIIENDNADLDAVSTVAFGGGAGGMTIAAADIAKDAIAKVDGVDVTSASNKFSNTIQDLSFTALKVGAAGEKARIDVAYDTAGVEKLMDEFIKAYNNAVGTIDYHTKVGAGLYGDSTMRGLKTQLTNSLQQVVTGAGPFETIFDVGLGLKKDGTLEKSSLVRSMSEALTDNYADFGKLFSSVGGFAGGIKDLLEKNLDAKGSFTFRQDNINLSLRDLEVEREKHDYRMSQMEVRLRAQYANLDSLIAQMQSSGSFLQSQLGSLPGFVKSK
ncbi:flagellar filament capping protein FliD [Rheinheimera sp.]|uniref:flagellar filament capping protein FliD n=1 Tax=Rheinheimera sp. TaxID=1869214 RepID=UPI0027B9E1F4|nr:flagellar filament capping protein FliD [Rheinheimera sp.]